MRIKTDEKGKKYLIPNDDAEQQEFINKVFEILKIDRKLDEHNVLKRDYMDAYKTVEEMYIYSIENLNAYRNI